MTIKYEPADYYTDVLVWLGIHDAVMAKAKELGSEEEGTEVKIQYEGIAPGGNYEGMEMVSVSKNGSGERFFY